MKSGIVYNFKQQELKDFELNPTLLSYINTLSENDTISGVYAIYNYVEDKIYIGSSKDVQRRIAQHFYSLKRNEGVNFRLQNSFNKYGENSFIVFILEEAQEKINLQNAENKYLAIFQSYKPELGYNILNSAYANYKTMRLTNPFRKTKRNKNLKDRNYIPKQKIKTPFFIMPDFNISYTEKGYLIEVKKAKEVIIKYI